VTALQPQRLENNKMTRERLPGSFFRLLKSYILCLLKKIAGRGTS